MPVELKLNTTQPSPHVRKYSFRLEKPCGLWQPRMPPLSCPCCLPTLYSPAENVTCPPIGLPSATQLPCGVPSTPTAPELVTAKFETAPMTGCVRPTCVMTDPPGLSARLIPSRLRIRKTTAVPIRWP